MRHTTNRSWANNTEKFQSECRLGRNRVLWPGHVAEIRHLYYTEFCMRSASQGFPHLCSTILNLSMWDAEHVFQIDCFIDFCSKNEVSVAKFESII